MRMSVNGGNSAIAEQACKECRRRKSKCDRTIPVCHLCGKFNRRCMYERPSRTPLTRAYLAKVEAELARTQALLRRFIPDQGRGPNPDDGALPGPATPSNIHDRIDWNQESMDIPGPSLRSPLDQPLYSNTGPPGNVEAPSPTPMRARSAPHSVGTIGFSLETPPSSSNFEWDERAGTVSGDGFVDGMASLTSRSNEGGYLDNDIPMTYESSGQTSQHQHSTIPFALTSMSQLEPFVDSYFRLYHCSYPIVHEATFRAQFMEIIPRSGGNAWQVLLFVISALGVFTSTAQPTDIDLALFDAAKERLSIDVLETGNIVLVQTLTLISNYLQKRNKPNSGYNYMGLARRVAMGIGLHKEFPTWDATPLTLEMRRRVWHCLYIFDIGAIITFSRPLDVPEDGVDVQLPLNTHDGDITAATKQMPIPAQETTIYTHLREQTRFHLTTSHIYSKIISHPLPSAAEVIGMDDQLIGGWLAELPAFFNETAVQAPKFSLCHAILRWRYRNFRILMYRPFLVGHLMSRLERGVENPVPGEANSHVNSAIERCLHAAREAVDLISLFWRHEQRTMMACWYGLYFLFQAILIPVVCLRNDPQSPLADGWRGQVSQAVEVLESMAYLNPTAQRCLDVIQSLCGTYLQPTVDGWGLPTEESPQTQLANLYPLMWPTLELGQLDGGDTIIQESTIMDFMNRLPTLE
ncbi:fungal-specific transcription factor domain-containing protein [Aspergillus californicus]